MQPFDPHRAPTEVLPFTAADDHMSYLVGCGLTRAAVLIDPHPELKTAYEEALERAQVRLLAVFFTGPRPDVPTPWDAIRTIGSREANRLLAEQHNRITVAASPPTRFRIELIGVGDPDRVAYRIADRVFAGADLIRDADGQHPTTPEPLLDTLEDHLILYSGFAHGDPSPPLTLVACERSAATPKPAPLRRMSPRVVEMTPTNEGMDYWMAVERGRTLALEERYDDARNLFELALVLKPGDAIATQNLARVRQLVGSRSAEEADTLTEVSAADLEEVSGS